MQNDMLPRVNRALKILQNQADVHGKLRLPSVELRIVRAMHVSSDEAKAICTVLELLGVCRLDSDIEMSRKRRMYCIDTTVQAVTRKMLEGVQVSIASSSTTHQGRDAFTTNTSPATDSPQVVMTRLCEVITILEARIAERDAGMQTGADVIERLRAALKESEATVLKLREELEAARRHAVTIDPEVASVLSRYA